MKLFPILLTATIFLVGCFDEDDEKVTGGSSTPGGSSALVGTWSGDIDDEESGFTGTQTLVFAASTFEMDVSVVINEGAPMPFIEFKGTYTATADSITLVPTECLTVNEDALIVAIFTGSPDPIPLSVDCMEPDDEGDVLAEPMGGTYTIVGNTLTIIPEPDPENPDEDDTMVLQRQ